MQDIRWVYMDHWRSLTPRGLVGPYTSRRDLESFVRQIVGAGFEGIGMFAWNIPLVAQMFGTFQGYVDYLKDRGLPGGVVDIFWASPNRTPAAAPHEAATHDSISATLRSWLEAVEGRGVENMIVMPTNAFRDMEPVTDDKLDTIADLWNRVGRDCTERGVKLSVHHEFWGGIRTRPQIDRFYQITDPAHVWLFIDTAQHVIAEVDPVALYNDYHARVSGFHFKDTRHIDTVEDYRIVSDPELAASTTGRWFHEMGTPGGLVDFPALMRAMAAKGYRGWVGVEHDKADVGGDYAEATALGMWYARSVLEPAYAEGRP